MSKVDVALAIGLVLIFIYRHIQIVRLAKKVERLRASLSYFEGVTFHQKVAESVEQYKGWAVRYKESGDIQK